MLSAHIPALGCLQLVVARKRTIPLTLNPMKQNKSKTPIRQAVGATRNTVNQTLKPPPDTQYHPEWDALQQRAQAHHSVRFPDGPHGL